MVSAMDMSSVTGLGTTVGTTQPPTQASASSSQTSSTSTASASSSSSVYYSSPILTMDPMTGALIQEWRDPNTGEELYQSPNRIALLYGNTHDRTASSSSLTQSSSSAAGQSGSQRSGSVSLIA